MMKTNTMGLSNTVTAVTAVTNKNESNLMNQTGAILLYPQQSIDFMKEQDIWGL